VTVRRWLTRSGPALAVLVTLLTLACPSTAYAIPGISDCKEAPTPQAPGRGFTSMFGDPARVPPAEDPFKPGARTTVYEQYGYAGVGKWSTYDLGCGGAARDPQAGIDNWLGNIMMSFATIAVAATNAITQASRAPTFLGVFNPLMVDVSQALMQGVALVWIPLVLALAAVLMIARAHKEQTAKNVHAVGWALMVLFVLTVLVRWPVEAGSAADKSVTATVGAADQGLAKVVPDDPGTGSGAAGQVLYEAVLWRPWLTGVFGDYDSATAEKYGPDLFKSVALSWSEKATLESDPDGAGKKLVDGKKKAFEDIASKIKDEDPDAYEHLQGKAGGRAQMGVWAMLTAALILPFLLMAALLLLAGFMLLRLLVVLFPLFATIGVMDSASAVVRGVARTALACVVNMVLFGILAAVAAQFIGFTMLGAGLPGWLALLLSVIVMWLFWVLTKPFRSLTRMVSPNSMPLTGMNPQQDAHRARLLVAHAVATAWGAKKGVEWGQRGWKTTPPFEAGIDDGVEDDPWTEPAPPPPPPPARPGPAGLPASEPSARAATFPVYDDVYARFTPTRATATRLDDPAPEPVGAGTAPLALPAGAPTTGAADGDSAGATLFEADESAAVYDPDSGETVNGDAADQSTSTSRPMRSSPWDER
jgi:hypothetical protein